MKNLKLNELRNHFNLRFIYGGENYSHHQLPFNDLK